MWVVVMAAVMILMLCNYHLCELTARAETRMSVAQQRVVGGMATIPNRKEHLEIAVRSLEGQLLDTIKSIGPPGWGADHWRYVVQNE